MIPIEHVIGLSVILFAIGIIGALTRRNIIVIMMSIELMLNSSNLAFVAFDRMWSRHPIPGAAPALDGQIFVLFVICIAAAEIAVGLAILVALVRNRDSINVEDASQLKW